MPVNILISDDEVILKCDRSVCSSLFDRPKLLVWVFSYLEINKDRERYTAKVELILV